jgi:hypothetical protein
MPTLREQQIQGLEEMREREAFRRFLLVNTRRAIAGAFIGAAVFQSITWGPEIKTIICAVIGAILFGPDATELSLRATTWLFSRAPAKPDAEAGMSIARTLAARGQYLEAEEAFDAVARKFPNDPRPHVELIRIAVTCLHDQSLAEQFRVRGMRKLSSKAARAVLEEAFQRIITLPTEVKASPVISEERMEEVRDTLEKRRESLQTRTRL